MLQGWVMFYLYFRNNISSVGIIPSWSKSSSDEILLDSVTWQLHGLGGGTQYPDERHGAEWDIEVLNEASEARMTLDNSSPTNIFIIFIIASLVVLASLCQIWFFERVPYMTSIDGHFFPSIFHKFEYNRYG